MGKQQRKAALNRWKHAQHADLLAGMPLSPAQLHRLLDYLDASLEACDHTTKCTAAFLRTENLDSVRVLSWLAEQGGYCDCEVLANLEDLDDLLQRPAPVPRPAPQTKRNRVPRSLDTVAGWNLSSLPGEWRVANLYDSAEPIKLKFGRKGGCTVEIVESPLPLGDQAANDFWSRL